MPMFTLIINHALSKHIVPTHCVKGNGKVPKLWNKTKHEPPPILAETNQLLQRCMSC